MNVTRSRFSPAVPPDPSSFASVPPPPVPVTASLCLSRENLELPSFDLFFVPFFPSSFASLIVFTSQPVETFLPSPEEEGEEEEGRSTGSRRTHKLLLPLFLKCMKSANVNILL